MNLKKSKNYFLTIVNQVQILIFIKRKKKKFIELVQNKKKKRIIKCINLKKKLFVVNQQLNCM